MVFPLWNLEKHGKPAKYAEGKEREQMALAALAINDHQLGLFLTAKSPYRVNIFQEHEIILDIKKKQAPLRGRLFPFGYKTHIPGLNQLIIGDEIYQLRPILYSSNVSDVFPEFPLPDMLSEYSISLISLTLSDILP